LHVFPSRKADKPSEGLNHSEQFSGLTLVDVVA
jgi:hypothetical protein